MKWRIEMLGALRVAGEGRVVDRFQTRATETVLALLAWPPATPRTRDELAGLVWPDANSQAGRVRLTQALSWLRGNLSEDLFVADSRTVGLLPVAFETDVARFDHLLNEADRDSAHAAELWREAVALYRGDLLIHHDGDWVLDQRHRLEARFLSALRGLVRFHGANGEWAIAEIFARRAYEIDAFSERSQADLLRSMVRSGNWEGAQIQYAAIARMMDREMGETPSDAVRAIIRRRAPDIAESNLPASLNRFFGREEELQRLDAAWGESGPRLITLSGHGGTGKTRLALEAGARAKPFFEDRVWFVSFAEKSGGVAEGIGDALNLPRVSGGDLTRAISRALAEQRSLLILDNLEDVLEEAAAFVVALLKATPLLRILATSRGQLYVEGEQLFALSPLPVEEDSAAVRLFIDRARSVRPDFVSDSDVPLVVARLEGIPLAIELCAAWAQMLSTSEMLEWLDRRFEMLVSRRQDMPARHRTLWAALESSYLSLPADLQRLFRVLSVFRGGWTLEAARTVIQNSEPEVLYGLARLRGLSLVLSDPSEGEVGTRYRMLETLREFAAEQLAEEERDEARARHAAYYSEFAQSAAANHQGALMTRLAKDAENVFEALDWATDTGHTDLGLPAATAMATFWFVRRHFDEGTRKLEALLHAHRGEDAATAAAWTALGQLRWALGDLDGAAAAQSRALNIRRDLTDPSGISESLLHLGIVAYHNGEYELAETHLREAMAIAERVGNDPVFARALLNLGNVAADTRSATVEAREMYAKALEIQTRLGDRYRMADALNNIGTLLLREGNLDEAETALLRSLEIRRETTASGVDAELINLAQIAMSRADLPRAREYLREGFLTTYRAGNQWSIANYLFVAGRYAVAQKCYEVAFEALEESRRILSEMHASFPPTNQAFYDAAMREVEVNVPEGKRRALQESHLGKSAIDFIEAAIDGQKPDF